jgi:hypothetical protein
MKNTIIALLKPVAEWCHDAVSGIPLWVAAGIYVLVLAVLAAWVLTLKRERAGEKGYSCPSVIFHDLRLWAVLVLFVQAIIYVILR